MGSQGSRRGGSATLAPPTDADQPAALDDGHDWDNAVLRSCACGYVTTEPGRCPACGARDPAGPGAHSPRRPPPPPSGRFVDAGFADGPAPLADRAGSRAAWTVVGIVALNIVQQVIVVGLIMTGKLETGPAIRLSLLAGLVFYSIVAFWVLARSAHLGVHPVVTSGHTLTGAAEGAIVGIGLAIVLVAGAYVVTGHAVLDPVAAALANENLAALVVGAVLIALVAPVVEELVFRGFLAEALRPKGKWVALALSAAAFSVAHLRFAQFRYYVALGLVLGWLYWRRGLVASVMAHACFNGMLVVAAIAASHGPPVTLTGGGASITVPAAWHSVAPTRGDLIAATGPSGARIAVSSFDTGVAIKASQLAANVARGGGVGPPGTSVDPSSVVLLDLPAGPAVSMEVTVGTHHGRAVMVPRGTVLWAATIETAGSARASTDFQAALNTLQLPSAPGGVSGGVA